MTWAFAFFGCFTVLIVGLWLGFMLIYYKEFTREEKVIQELLKAREKDYGGLPPVYYVVPSNQKTKKTSEKEEAKVSSVATTDKSKKNIN